MANTFTARDTLKTKLLAALGSATNADQIVKLSRTIEKANLDDDADLETALDTKVSAMATSASTEDIEKLAFGVKKLRTETTATDPVSSMIPEGSSNLYVTDSRVRSSFSAAGDLSYNSGTGVLSYTALPDALTVYATVADLPSSGVAAGAKGIVEENKKLYIFTGASWVGVGLVDQKPSFTTTPDGTYTLSPGGDTVITLSATDPQGDPITFSHVVSAGSLGGSTVSQSGNVFTITGSSDTNDTAPFTLTFRASDGTNITDTTSEFTVQFVVPAKIVVGAYYADANGQTSAGAVYVYDLDGTNEVKIAASDAGAYDSFGYSVAVSDGKIIVGANKDDDNGNDSGAVYIYDLDGTNEVKITASDAAESDEFGYSVAGGDNKIVVGAFSDDGNGFDNGAVYVYDLDGTNEVKIIASDRAQSDNFGQSVAVGNNKIVVGAYGDDDNGSASGSVYVYDLDGSNEFKITSADVTAWEYFGYRVAVGENKIVVGSYRNDNESGSVHVYNLDGSNEVHIKASDSANGDYFGDAIAVGEGKIVVGARNEDENGTNAGAVYIYDLNGNNEVKLMANSGTDYQYFGSSVGVADGKIVVGAFGDSSIDNQSGAIYIYDLGGSNEIKVTASDGGFVHKFGSAVSLG
tara:strand:+ start:22212 stop:24116 length:1905 start_codon:yes stop_codon:yes gene_type:complete